MLDIVIIGKNEGESVKSMLDSLQTYLPKARRVWILDRNTDSSLEFLTSHGEFVVPTPFELSDTTRHVSYCRNLGLGFTRPTSDVIFLDGDRSIESFCSGFLRKSKDVLLFPVEKDERDDPKWFTKYSQVYGQIHNGFYSCGVFFKRSAIEKILAFQGCLFDQSLEKYWGIEDVHLGDVCYHLGLSCDLYKRIRLHGSFDNTKKIPLDAWRLRILKRLRLNVIW